MQDFSLMRRSLGRCRRTGQGRVPLPVPRHDEASHQSGDYGLWSPSWQYVAAALPTDVVLLEQSFEAAGTDQPLRAWEKPRSSARTSGVCTEHVHSAVSRFYYMKPDLQIASELLDVDLDIRL
jgi:hypothetical protein